VTNVFDRAVTDSLVARLQALTPDTRPQWGRMDAAQMLAHCAKPYETVLDPQYAIRNPRPNAILRLLLRLFLKPIVTGPRPYKRNSRTAPEFVVADQRNFAVERARLIGYVQEVQRLGVAHFEGKESHSFGALTSAEWSMLFHKHLDHHLVQFGV